MSKIQHAHSKAKKLVKKALYPLSPKQEVELKLEDVTEARKYIKDFWKVVKRHHPKDDESLLGLPYPYLVPSYREKTGFDYNELYYWDSFFMAQGLLDNEHKDIVIGMLEDLMYLFKRFKVIPNASRTYLTGRSQPPFLTTYIFNVYDAYSLDNDWLKKSIEVAKEEYRIVWMGEKKPNERLVYKNLSRYYDINYLHDLAEAESGWDMTPRFDRKALNFLPVDLNALLYKYESDFIKAAKIFNDQAQVKYWEEQASIRASRINELMWDKNKGLFFDYNFVKQKRSDTASLASYFPMWAGMVSDEQAAALVKSLRRFEHKGGLATTDSLPLGQFVIGTIPTQWAYPNGWAPLHFIVIEALKRYGYEDDARRIAMKWLSNNLNWFNINQVFLEKYNVVSPEKPPLKGVYPSQTGFGWTNSVFERLCQDFIDLRQL